MSPDKEADFLEKNKGMEIRRFPNGTICVAATELRDDLRIARININHRAGSIFDPVHKTGIHHLLEHLIANVPSFFSRQNKANFEAFTSKSTMLFEIDGPANKQVLDFGAWPLLSILHRQVVNPIWLSGNLESDLKREKGVVDSEEIEYKSDHYIQFMNFVSDTIYHPNNPIGRFNIGAKEDRDSITSADIKELIPQAFSPEGTIISVLNRGELDTTKIIVDQLEDTYGKVEETPGHQILDSASFSKLNPGFKQEETYYKDTGLNNGIISLAYIWVFPYERGTTSAFALGRLKARIDEIFFAMTRIRGQNYTSNIRSIAPTGDTWVGQLDLTFPKMKEIEDVAREYKKIIENEVIARIDLQEIHKILEQERKINQAMLIPTESKLEYMTTGIKDEGMIIDPESVKRAYSQISTKDIEEWRDKLLETEPAIIMVGDLSG